MERECGRRVAFLVQAPPLHPQPSFLFLPDGSVRGLIGDGGLKSQAQRYKEPGALRVSRTCPGFYPLTSCSVLTGSPYLIKLQEMGFYYAQQDAIPNEHSFLEGVAFELGFEGYE